MKDFYHNFQCWNKFNELAKGKTNLLIKPNTSLIHLLRLAVSARGKRIEIKRFLILILPATTVQSLSSYEHILKFSYGTLFSLKSLTYNTKKILNATYILQTRGLNYWEVKRLVFQGEYYEYFKICFDV